MAVEYSDKSKGDLLTIISRYRNVQAGNCQIKAVNQLIDKPRFIGRAEDSILEVQIKAMRNQAKRRDL